MAIVSVTANVNGENYPLNENAGVYEELIVAPPITSQVNVMALDDEGNETTESTTIYVTSNWLPPKTDWKATDFINYVDVNRIMYNLIYLRGFAKSMYFDTEELADMGVEKGFEDIPYASLFNAFEKNLEIINNSTYKFDIGETKEYSVNGNTTDYNELNRIESAMLRIFYTLKAQYDALNTMPFTLGGEKGIRC